MSASLIPIFGETAFKSQIRDLSLLDEGICHRTNDAFTGKKNGVVLINWYGKQIEAIYKFFSVWYEHGVYILLYMIPVPCMSSGRFVGLVTGEMTHSSPLVTGEMTHSSPPPVTAKILVDASLARAITCEENKIFDQTGVELNILEHVSDPNIWNIELKGKFVEVKVAISMVTELIGKIPGAPASQPSIYK